MTKPQYNGIFTFIVIGIFCIYSGDSAIGSPDYSIVPNNDQDDIDRLVSPVVEIADKKIGKYFVHLTRQQKKDRSNLKAVTE